MPVAAVGAAATVGVGYMQHRAANNAAKAQKQATDAALTHETSRESIADKRYNDAWADYQKRHAAWEQRNFGGGAAAPAAGGGGQAGPTVNPQAAMGQMGMGGGGTLQQLAGGAPGGMAQQGGDMSAQSDVSGGDPRTLRDVAEWNDWRGYGLGT